MYLCFHLLHLSTSQGTTLLERLTKQRNHSAMMRVRRCHLGYRTVFNKPGTPCKWATLVSAVRMTYRRCEWLIGAARTNFRRRWQGNGIENRPAELLKTRAEWRVGITMVVGPTVKWWRGPDRANAFFNAFFASCKNPDLKVVFAFYVIRNGIASPTKKSLLAVLNLFFGILMQSMAVYEVLWVTSPRRITWLRHGFLIVLLALINFAH